MYSKIMQIGSMPPAGCHNFAVCGEPTSVDFAETLRIGEPGELHRRIYVAWDKVSGMGNKSLEKIKF
jgi:hypothetical protein